MKRSLLISVLACLLMAAGNFTAQAQSETWNIGPRFGVGVSQPQYKGGSPNGVRPLLVYHLGAYTLVRPDLAHWGVFAGLGYHMSGYAIVSSEYPTVNDQPVGAPIKPNVRNLPTSEYEERNYYHYATAEAGGRLFFRESTRSPYLGAGLRVGRRLAVNKLVLDPEWYNATNLAAARENMRNTSNLTSLQGLVTLGSQYRQFFMELEFAPYLTDVQKGPGAINPRRFLQGGINLGYGF